MATGWLTDSILAGVTDGILAGVTDGILAVYLMAYWACCVTECILAGVLAGVS